MASTPGNYWKLLEIYCPPGKNSRKIKKKEYLLENAWNLCFYSVLSLVAIFFQLLFGCPLANFGSLLRGQPHSPDVNLCVLHFWPEGHRELHIEVGSLSPGECLVGNELGTFRFLLQHLNPLGYFPEKLET